MYRLLNNLRITARRIEYWPMQVEAAVPVFQAMQCKRSKAKHANGNWSVWPAGGTGKGWCMMDGMHAYYWAASGGQDPAGPALLIS
jgi:hypothetical protein